MAAEDASNAGAKRRWSAARGCMGHDVLRRVRWGNVARAGVAVGIAALVVAWPRLTPESPRLPSGANRPLAGEGAARSVGRGKRGPSRVRIADPKGPTVRGKPPRRAERRAGRRRAERRGG